jgi:transcription initiation factor TFIIB
MSERNLEVRPGQAGARTCPECGGAIRSRELERVCDACGLVVDETAIDRGPNWNTSEEGPDDRHVGSPVTEARHDKGLSTEIGYGSGSEVSGRRQRQLLRMRQQHNRARFSSKADRNRLYAFTAIRRLTSSLSLPGSIRDQACRLFESAQSEDLLCGRSLEGFVAANVYAACRVQSVARTIEEVVAEARADEEELKAAYDALNRSLGLPLGPIHPGEYLPRYASELNLETDVERRAREYVELLDEANAIAGKNPSGVAAACLYRAAYDFGVDVTQVEVAEVADVSRMTIRARVTELKRYA